MALDQSMIRWHEAAKTRFSVRKYIRDPSERDLDALKAAAELLRARGVRIEILSSEDVFRPMFLWYGKIKGVKTFAALIHDQSAMPESIGYIGEAFILECTALGLGTCWLGGTFSRSKALELVSLGANEKLSCIIPIGVPDEPYAERGRKSVEKLTGLSMDEFEALPDWQKHAITCARRAPSAVNRQPWKFLVDENSINVKNISYNYGYGRLDCGIAMLHIELGAAHAGVYGEWRSTEHGSIFTPETAEING